MDNTTLRSNLDDASVKALFEQCYGVQVLALQRMVSDTGKRMYRVRLKHGVDWTLRIVDDIQKEEIVALTRLLAFLEELQYPAERPVLTSEQNAYGAVDHWHFCATTFLVGAPVNYTPTSLALLGAAVGRLHALKRSPVYTPPQAEMLPARELAFARQQLSGVKALVPRQYIRQYDVLETALLSIDHGAHLPVTLIHNDCHPANALLTAPQQVTLLDWEGAGLGAAVLDVGFLLANCDGKAPWDSLTALPVHPDKARLQAVIEGYTRWYRLSPEELAYLSDALRFRALVFGACSFAEAIAHNQPAEFTRWWWARYNMADEVAGQASRYFEQALSQQ